MKKRWLIVAGCISAYVLVFVIRMLGDAWIDRTWGTEQSLRVMPFMDALLQFLAPVVFYVAYRWGPVPKTRSSADRRALKYLYTLVSISSVIAGLARLVNGLGQMSAIPLLQALDISSGMHCVAILPALAGGVLYGVISSRSGPSKEHQAS